MEGMLRAIRRILIAGAAFAGLAVPVSAWRRLRRARASR